MSSRSDICRSVKDNNREKIAGNFRFLSGKIAGNFPVFFGKIPGGKTIFNLSSIIIFY